MKRNQGRCFYGGERGAVTLFARFHMRKLPHCHGWIFNILSIKISQIKSGILLFLLQTEENALRAHGWLNTNMRRLNTVARAAPAVVPRISVWLPFVSDCRLGFFLSCFCLGQTGWGRHAGPRVARFRGDCCSERVCAGPHHYHHPILVWVTLQSTITKAELQLTSCWQADKQTAVCLEPPRLGSHGGGDTEGPSGVDDIKLNLWDRLVSVCDVPSKKP